MCCVDKAFARADKQLSKKEKKIREKNPITAKRKN